MPKHFKFYQYNGVAMGSPLGPLLANVFMCSLEKSIVPTLKDCLVHWRRNVDDTRVYRARQDRLHHEEAEHLPSANSIHL